MFSKQLQGIHTVRCPVPIRAETVKTTVSTSRYTQIKAKIQHVFQKTLQWLQQCMVQIKGLFKKQKVRQEGALYTVSYKVNKSIGDNPYFVLALDGGGVRGIIPITILSEIEKIVGKKIVTLFDQIAGTSAGGITTAGLVVPDEHDPSQTKYTAEDIKKLFTTVSEEIFTESFSRKVISLDGAVRSKYPSPEKVFQRFVGDTPISDCMQTKILLTGYDVRHATPVLFTNDTEDIVPILESHNIHMRAAPSTVAISDAVLATTAAPTYFPSVAVADSVCIDGGIILNNPAQLATLIALKEVENRPIFVLSLGTGVYNNYAIDEKTSFDWGYLQWASPLIHSLLDASSRLASDQLQLLADSHPNISYVRLQVHLENEEEARMDNSDARNLQKLQDLALASFQHYLEHGGKEVLIASLQQRAGI